MTWDEQQQAQEAARRVARAALSRRTVGLKDQRDWFEERAADPLTPAKDRALWQRLADEVTVRLGDRQQVDDQPLF